MSCRGLTKAWSRLPRTSAAGGAVLPGDQIGPEDPAHLPPVGRHHLGIRLLVFTGPGVGGRITAVVARPRVEIGEGMAGKVLQAAGVAMPPPVKPQGDVAPKD